MLYTSLFFLNNWAFSALEFTAGVNWLYLPAGLRLLLVLMFGLSGASGIAFGSASISMLVYFQDDPFTGLVAGLISGFAPYGVQALMQRFANLQRNLADITAISLLQLALFYSFATSFGHQVWYTLRGVTTDFWASVWPMFVGDLLGTLLILYSAHAVIKLVRYKIASR